MVKKLAVAMDAENFNVLQNNGRLAHQEVDHVGSPCPFAKSTLFFFFFLFVVVGGDGFRLER